MRTVLTLLVAACAGNAGAQIVSRDSLHLKPVGTVLNGSFALVNRVVPLPEGDFVLVAKREDESRFVRGDMARQEHKMVTVVLAQMADGRLRAAVGARTVLKYRSNIGWVNEPCKAGDDRVHLFMLNRVPYMKRNYEQNCLLVDRRASSLGRNASGAYADLRDWVGQQGGTTPIPMAIDVSITRVAVVEYLTVRYLFNPAAFGCDAAALQSAEFAAGVIQVGKAMQSAVNEGFSGRAEAAQSMAATAPRLQQDCGSSLQRGA